jgi:hypothetical protein
MALEVGTFISDLVATNPTSTDPKAEGDDHIRLLKSTVKATFPNVTGAVLPTHTELNFVDGVTSGIQGQLNARAPINNPTFTGTVTIPSGASIADYAPLNSPALTGVPTAPTAAPGTNTTQLATTEFVVSQAFSSALPGQTGNAGKFLSTNGTAASWETVAGVSSVGLTVPAFLSVANSPITSSGTLAVTFSGSALPVANGGTGVTTSTGSGANVLNNSPSLVTPDWTENIQVISTNTNAVRSRTYVITASLTLTLPASPTAGDWVAFQNSSGTTTAVIARNGQNIMSLAEDLTLDAGFVAVRLVFADATRGWVFG